MAASCCNVKRLAFPEKIVILHWVWSRFTVSFCIWVEGPRQPKGHSLAWVNGFRDRPPLFGNALAQDIIRLQLKHGLLLQCSWSIDPQHYQRDWDSSSVGEQAERTQKWRVVKWLGPCSFSHPFLCILSIALPHSPALERQRFPLSKRACYGLPACTVLCRCLCLHKIQQAVRGPWEDLGVGVSLAQNSYFA